MTSRIFAGLLLLAALAAFALPASAGAASACDGTVAVSASLGGSALILSDGEFENLRYGRELLADARGKLTPSGRRVAADPKLLAPFVATIDKARPRCGPSTFKASHAPKACGGNHDECCDNTGDLDEILCLADLISLCSDASNCTLIPGSGGQGPVCVCTD